MIIKACVKCKEMYKYEGLKVCPKCGEEDIDEKEYGKVRDYLYEYPGSSISQVVSATGVSIKQLMEYIKQGRVTSNPANHSLICEE